MGQASSLSRFGINRTSSTGLNWPKHEMGVLMQIAAEAGSETKRIIEPDPAAVRGDHRDIVVGGLRAIAAGEYGPDYHGIVSSQAANLLDFFEWPLEASEA